MCQHDPTAVLVIEPNQELEQMIVSEARVKETSLMSRKEMKAHIEVATHWTSSPVILTNKPVNTQNEYVHQT